MAEYTDEALASKTFGEGVVQSAKDFFGQDFSATASAATEEVKKGVSKTLEFFGVDFGTTPSPPLQKPPVEPVKAPRAHSIDTIFPDLIQAESKGKHLDEQGRLVRSKVGAEGITQLMPKTAAKPGYGITPAKDKSEAEYLRVGKEYLQKMYDKFRDWEKALAAYNAGVGTVMKAEGKAERFGGDWKGYLPKKEETLPYIKKIMGGIKESALKGAEMYAGASQPVDIASMAGESLGDKTFDATGSAALATAANMGASLGLDPSNLVPPIKGGSVLALGVIGAFKKSAHEIAIPLTKAEKSFVKEGAFSEQWNEFTKHEGIKWFDKPNFRIFGDELTYHPQDNPIVERFFKWLADAPAGERKGIPPKFLTGAREADAAIVGAGGTAKSIESPLVNMGPTHPDHAMEAAKVFAQATPTNSVKHKDYTLIKIDNEPEHAIAAFDKSGKQVGQMSFVIDDKFHPDVFVDAAHKRQGIASAMYDYAQKSGWKLTSGKGAVRSNEGSSFRAAYDAKQKGK